MKMARETYLALADVWLQIDLWWILNQSRDFTTGNAEAFKLDGQNLGSLVNGELLLGDDWYFAPGRSKLSINKLKAGVNNSLFALVFIFSVKPLRLDKIGKCLIDRFGICQIQTQI
jgi:hypothetical protein